MIEKIKSFEMIEKIISLLVILTGGDLGQWRASQLKRWGISRVETTDGYSFGVDGIKEANEVLGDVDFSGIGEGDAVLDLGAHVGGFAIRAAKYARMVYAVEPVFAEELRANIKKNGMEDKITVLECALGDGKKERIVFDGKEKVVQTYTVPELLKKTGDITFLKVDVEGAEWAIKPEHLLGIRRIEFEAHVKGYNQKLEAALKENWFVKEQHRPFLHGRERHFHCYPKTTEVSDESN